MAAFQFPDPAVETTVVNPITGSTYQWKFPPGKWVVTTKIRSIDNIIWEGDDEPDPNPGEYKLWYHTDKLELYFWYEDVNGNGAWVPTSAPITMLDDLDTALAEVKADVVAANVVINEHENRLDSIIYFGTTPPPILPDNVYTDIDGNVTTEQNEVNYKFWLNTTDNQLSILRIDADASSGYSYAEVSSNPDLQEVLDNGAIANKGMILKTSDPNIEGSSEYDAIEIIPAGARVIVSAEDNAGWKPTLELIELVPQDAGATRKAQIELDDNRLDINVDSVEDEIHFRFNDNDKLVLKGMTEPSQLKGKLIVEPGTSGNEAVTYGQLATVAEELEQLAPSIEHGSWTWTTNQNPGPGQYTTIQESDDDKLAECASTWQECLVDAGTDNIAKAQCQREYDACIAQYKPGPNPDFSKTYQIKFNNQDSQGNDVTFDTVEVGQLIDVFNESNDDYLVGEITVKSSTTFTITRKSSKGFASGLGRIKIFTLNDQVEDLTNYVRKTGDTMEGQLMITGSSKTGPLLVVEPTTAGKADTLFAVNDKDGDPVFDVANNGQAFYERTPDADAEIVNKKYVDTKFGNTMPVGAIVFWGGLKERIPDGWVECRGQTAPSSVQSITGLTNIPNLKDYMPAGVGGVFGDTLGNTEDSKFKSHSHTVSRKEPGNTTGNPDGSGDTSTGRYRYWRGNDSNSGISGAGISRTTTTVGDDITAPPVYLGVYIMKVA